MLGKTMLSDRNSNVFLERPNSFSKSSFKAPKFEQKITIEEEISTEQQLFGEENFTRLEVFQEVIDEHTNQLNNELSIDGRTNEEVKVRNNKKRRHTKKNTKAILMAYQDKFNQLTDSQKQQVVNYTMDAVLDRVEERKY